MEQSFQNQPSRILRGPTIAVFIGASVALVMIGVFNLLADVSPKIKIFLTLNKAVGPWSGKVVFGYLAGAIAWFLAWTFLRGKDGNITRWFWIFFAALVIGTSLVFTPFLHVLIG
ncbi:MAG: hypothetical protein Q7S09_03810 [bacterium]|nr:hypothetical protein [bacterium]